MAVALAFVDQMKTERRRHVGNRRVNGVVRDVGRKSPGKFHFCDGGVTVELHAHNVVPASAESHSILLGNVAIEPFARTNGRKGQCQRKAVTVEADASPRVVYPRLTQHAATANNHVITCRCAPHFGAYQPRGLTAEYHRLFKRKGTNFNGSARMQHGHCRTGNFDVGSSRQHGPSAHCMLLQGPKLGCAVGGLKDCAVFLADLKTQKRMSGVVVLTADAGVFVRS